jgi:hypothetical protein
MHSQHATTTAQDALNTLIYKYPPHPLVITLTKVITNPYPNSNAVQDTTLPDNPTTTTLVVKDRWKTVDGKEVWKKRRNKKANNKLAAKTVSNIPKVKTGGREKNTHQPKPTTPSVKKTSAEVIKSRGINVQIVLGNSKHHHGNGDPHLRSPQPPPKSSMFPSNSDLPYSIPYLCKFSEHYT